jgi:hypothetical protein
LTAATAWAAGETPSAEKLRKKMPRLAWHNAQMLILVEMNTMQMTAKEHRTVIAALP